MLHEILPSKIDNGYKEIEPDCKSRCIGFVMDNILVYEGEELRFPKYEEIKYEVGEMRYLFTIDDTNYFLAELNSDTILGCELISLQKLRQKKPKKEVFAGMTAYHLYVWYSHNKYCGKCSNELIHDNKERMLFCKNCENRVYPKIMPAVIVGIINGDKILVTKYRGRAYGGYALIAGFLEIGESAEEAVCREVFEEVGVRVKNIRYYKSQPWGIAQDLLLGYFCELDGDDTISIDEEELELGHWIAREELDVKYDDVSLTNEMLCIFKGEMTE